MTKYIVTLMNFGNEIYYGNDLIKARREAERRGFEAILASEVDGETTIQTYSPIGGWR